ncbi:MAG: M23 family metallopeptidase [Actinobacteria bacterium]|nr:M23 family metallopeptidase [Actinomycetota bacterium]
MSDRWLNVVVEQAPPKAPPRTGRRPVPPAAPPPPRRSIWPWIAGTVVVAGLAAVVVGAWLVAASVMRWNEISRDAAAAGQDLGARSETAAASLADDLDALASTASTLGEVSAALDAAANIAADLQAVADDGVPSGPDGVVLLVREIDLLAEAIDAAFPGLAELGVADTDGPGGALQAAGRALIEVADTLVPRSVQGFGSFVLRHPMPGYVVTAPFGTARDTGFHGGVDFAAPGGTPILAADDGLVIQAGWLDASAGNGVILEHDHGWETRYFHMADAGVPVSAGDRVAAGDVIGYVGSTGESTGPHLHFEIVFGPIRLDPEDFTYVGGVSGADAGGVPPTAEAPDPAAGAPTVPSGDAAAGAAAPSGIGDVQQELLAIGAEASDRAAALEGRRVTEERRGETAALLLYGGAVTMALGLLLWGLQRRWAR